MVRRWALILGTAALSFAGGIACVQSETGSDAPPDVDTPEAAVEAVRALYFERDFSQGRRFGQQYQQAFPEALRLEAWTLLHRAEDTYLRLDEEQVVRKAVAAADSLAETHPDSPWGWFALAGTAHHLDDETRRALAASREALKRAPSHPDVVWARARALISADSIGAAHNFIDGRRPAVDNPAPLLTLKGKAFAARSESPRDSMMNRALSAYEQARSADSTFVNAYMHAGWHHLRRRDQSEKAYPLLKQAAQLAPTSVDVHEEYWRSIIGLPNRPDSTKIAEIESDVRALLRERQRDVPALYAAAQTYSRLDADEKKETLRKRLVAEAPNSVEAEWTRVQQYREFRRAHQDSLRSDPTLRAEYRSMLTQFIDRPTHHNVELVGGAYRALFHLAKADSTVSGDRLLELVNGLVAHETANPDIVYADAPIELAERTAHHDRALEIARKGLDQLPKEARKDSAFYDTDQELRRALDWASLTAHDAVGWVHFQMGNTQEAKKHLQRAHELDRKHQQRLDPGNLYHLGRLYESEGALEKAERFYVQGKSQNTMQKNPNARALKALYRKRNGSLEGYESYLSSVEEDIRSQRKKEVLSNRLETPKPLPPFRLATLEGDTLSAAELEGSIVVLNVWGKWCGPCVKEMPDIQKLYEKYRSSDEVRILTINNDDNPNDVREWMRENDYTFPVLLDDGYLSTNDVSAFPTTWVTSEERRIAFEKEGYTENLVEEFSWRVESLRGGGASSE